jgi:chaperonin cofactor prefoldin
MVFDIRGRRKHVVKFVYAILALLMGASLFLVVGPVNIGNLLGTSSTESASHGLEEQAERIEHKLKKSPHDPNLLLALTRARISVGNSLAAVNSETGAAEITAEGRAQLEEASSAWSEYLKVTDEPSSGGAQLVSPALFSLAQTSRTGTEAEANIHAATAAQEIIAKARPSLGSLSTLAIYRYFGFDYAGAAKAHKEAAKYANTKFERENLGNELEEIDKRAHEFQKQIAEYNKATKGKGKESLENPLGGLGGSSALSP